MGAHHARAYAQMPNVRLAGVHDASAQRAAAVAAECGTQAFDRIEALLDRVRAVTIATPTQFHLETAAPCLERGIACLIEKPLAATVDQCRRIVTLAEAHGALVQVGHIERFNPAIRALRALNLQPTFMDAARMSPVAFRSLDVGVVLDMMIHDIDIVLSLAGPQVLRCDSVGANVLGPAEDIANARIVFAGGCVANLTASRIATKAERRLHLYSSDACVSIDFAQRTGLVARVGGSLDALRDIAQRVRGGEIQDLSALKLDQMAQYEPLAVNDTNPLHAQVASFISAVRCGGIPQVTVQDGMRAVELAARIVNDMTTGPLA
jgi:predicted dehydrogenase